MDIYLGYAEKRMRKNEEIVISYKRKRFRPTSRKHKKSTSKEPSLQHMNLWNFPELPSVLHPKKKGLRSPQPKALEIQQYNSCPLQSHAKKSK